MLCLPPPMEPAPLRSRRSMQAPTDAVISWSPKRRPACRWPWSRLCHRHVHQLVASADRIRSTVRLVREARISNTLFLNARASVNQKRPLRQSSVPTCRIGADIDAVPGDAIRLAGVWFFTRLPCLPWALNGWMRPTRQRPAGCARKPAGTTRTSRRGCGGPRGRSRERRRDHGNAKDGGSGRCSCDRGSCPYRSLLLT